MLCCDYSWGELFLRRGGTRAESQLDGLPVMTRGLTVSLPAFSMSSPKSTGSRSRVSASAAPHRSLEVLKHPHGQGAFLRVGKKKGGISVCQRQSLSWGLSLSPRAFACLCPSAAVRPNGSKQALDPNPLLLNSFPPQGSQPRNNTLLPSPGATWERPERHP